jgi:DNA-binding transcriptional regulator YiaG
MTPSQIRALRKRRRLSPDDFASALGFNGPHARITVWRWEAGKRKPSAQTVALMKLLVKGLHVGSSQTGVELIIP